MHAYIISLSDQGHKSDPLRSALHAQGFQVDVVPAIDGRTGLPRQYEHLVDRQSARRRLRRDISDPELACALSHLGVYNAMLSQGQDKALVLEDDASIESGFLELISSLEQQAWDIVLLDHKGVRTSTYWGQETRGHMVCRVANIPDLTTAYLINAKAARHIIDHASPLSYVADWPCDISILQSWAVVPPIVGRPSDKDKSAIASARDQARTVSEFGAPRPPYAKYNVPAQVRRLFSRVVS